MLCLRSRQAIQCGWSPCTNSSQQSKRSYTMLAVPRNTSDNEAQKEQQPASDQISCVA